MNFLAGEIAGAADGRIEFRGKSGLPLVLPAANGKLRAGEGITVGVRPEHLKVIDPGKGMLSGEVQIAEHLGGETFLYVGLPSGETLVVEIQGQIAAQPGEGVGIDFEPGAHYLFSADGAALLGR